MAERRKFRSLDQTADYLQRSSFCSNTLKNQRAVKFA